MPAVQYQEPPRQQYASAAPPPQQHAPYPSQGAVPPQYSQAPLPQQYAPSQYLPQAYPPHYAPPQHMYPPPPQHLSPTVQCPSCASRFTPFTIQYESQFTTWQTVPSASSPAMPSNANIAPSPAQHPAMPPPAPAQPSAIHQVMPKQEPVRPSPALKQECTTPAPAPTQTIDIEAYTNKVRGIYNKYSSSSSSKEYDNSFDATSEIEAVVGKMKKQANNLSFAGKQDAITAILEIGLEMLLQDGSTLASEIRESYSWYGVGNAIDHIVDTLTPDELHELQTDGQMANDVDQLRQAAAEYAIDVELDDPFNKLDGRSHGEEE